MTETIVVQTYEQAMILILTPIIRKPANGSTVQPMRLASPSGLDGVHYRFDHHVTAQKKGG